MAEKFIIHGQKKLTGQVDISGSKNAAGAILSATLSTEEECTIDNLPLVEDVLNLLKILEKMGTKISWQTDRMIKIRSGPDVNPDKIDPELVSRSRIPVLLIGSLLSRFPSFKIPQPGGDRIGLRPISTHLAALEKMGIEISQEGSFYHIRKKGHLSGSEIILQEFSVTATENLMMVAVTAEGETIIKGAAAEPQVQDLGKLLINMGAKIEGLGTHTLFIEGGQKLRGASHKIIPDLLEAGTFLVAGAISQGEVEVRGVIPSHLDIFLAKLEEMGLNFEKNQDSIRVNSTPALKSVKIQALPYPGFPTDLLPVVVPLLTQAQGKSLVHDPLYESRFNYIQELRKMGADIEVVDPHRAFVFGKSSLSGLRIESWDIRAGASLIIAGLVAKGETTIENIYQIDRGYERIEEKFKKLGADIRRVSV